MTQRRMSRRIVLGGALVWLVALAPSRPSAEPAAPERTPRRLALRPASAALRGADSPPTPAWGFDGAVPGPVLKVRRGGEVWVTAANELPGPTAIHWHGLRIDNRMDGVPHLTQPPIAPGASFDYRFTCPDAGTFWYHTNSVEQLGRGLAGALIVEEDTAPAADHDLVLLLQDWLITAAGALDSTVAEPGTAGRVGSLATLNGQPGQDVAVKASDRVRLRLINATTARIAALTFEGGLKPVVVAVDGQPAEVFELGRPTLALPPGARVDVMVDMPAAATDASPPAIRLRGYGTDAVLARFVIDPGPPRRPDPLGKVAELPANPLPRTIELTGALRAELVMDGGGQESALAPAKEPTRERPRLLQRIPLQRTRSRRRRRSPGRRRGPCRLSPAKSGRRCSAYRAAAPWCWRWSTGRAGRTSFISTATMSACSTASTTAGSRGGTTPCWSATTAPPGSRSLPTIRASGCSSAACLINRPPAWRRGSR